ncbi:MAG: hypothetical protein AB1489_17710 [Acidobacteriota bacterium]
MKRDIFRITLLSTIFLLPTAAFSIESSIIVFDDNSKISANQVVERYVANRKSFTNRYANGQAQLSPAPGFNFPIRTGRVQIASDVNGVKIQFDFGGQVLWRAYDNGSAIILPVLPEKRLTDTVNNLLKMGLYLPNISTFDGLATFQLSQMQIKLKGEKKINGRECYLLEFKTKSPDPIKIYFDSKTFVITRVSFVATIESLQGTNAQTFSANTTAGVASNSSFFTVEYDFDDFRDVDGVLLPYSYTERLPFYTLEVKIDKYLSNTNPNDFMLVRPSLQ